MSYRNDHGAAILRAEAAEAEAAKLKLKLETRELADSILEDVPPAPQPEPHLGETILKLMENAPEHWRYEKSIYTGVGYGKSGFVYKNKLAVVERFLSVLVFPVKKKYNGIMDNGEMELTSPAQRIFKFSSQIKDEMERIETLKVFEAATE